ncbi:general stress protein [Sphingobacterium sp. DK4209]|uniref:General stress protein n=1 Tax=Sphingobacterium zhuxiongii TaxID=2662364 RepID=A0A5Q0QBN8_9SPHI|nr:MULTISPECIES: pyridoxamine 5'-phosphate oxidase family protein [unclassified Sphingobacterium]MVZ64634.1 general stress protein [Sphingobacterium sp. DK4209]QGA26973.1 general stress protein [Sphingobacterium sp. dk4302]
MSTENLTNQEAIEKLRKMVDKIDIGMLCSFKKDEKRPHAVPMSRQEVDEEGNIWYLFSKASETFENLQKDQQVTLIYSQPKDYEFITINGNAEISRDEARIEKYWNKMMEGWFEKGKEDPNIQVLKIVPSDAYYWDSESNKLVTLMKVAANAITGNNFEVGRDGKLSL